MNAQLVCQLHVTSILIEMTSTPDNAQKKSKEEKNESVKLESCSRWKPTKMRRNGTKQCLDDGHQRCNCTSLQANRQLGESTSNLVHISHAVKSCLTHSVSVSSRAVQQNESANKRSQEIALWQFINYLKWHFYLSDGNSSACATVTRSRIEFHFSISIVVIFMWKIKLCKLICLSGAQSVHMLSH